MKFVTDGRISKHENWARQLRMFHESFMNDFSDSWEGRSCEVACVTSAVTFLSPAHCQR